MKTGDLVDTLSFFSNEIVGTLLPGFVLLTGLRVFHFGFEIPSWIQSGNGIWFAVVGQSSRLAPSAPMAGSSNEKASMGNFWGA